MVIPETLLTRGNLIGFAGLVCTVYCKFDLGVRETNEKNRHGPPDSNKLIGNFISHSGAKFPIAGTLPLPDEGIHFIH